MAHVSIVTVTHNSADVIEGMLEALPADVEVVIVDNASSDGGAERVRAVRPDAIVLAQHDNQGFSRGCNVGVAQSSGDVIVLLNPDCRPAPGAIEVLVAAVVAEPRSIFGPALLAADGAPRHNVRRASRARHEILESLPSAVRWVPQRWRRDLPPTDPRYRDGGEVDYLQGACLAIARDLYARLGGFDEDFFLYSEEETLCLAVRAAGGRCVYMPAARVTHVAETSTRKVSTFALRHAARSRAIFYRKRYGDARGRLAAATIALATLVSWLIRPRASVPGGPRTRRGAAQLPALRGLWEGMTARVGRH